jgi:hypothetical protein
MRDSAGVTIVESAAPMWAEGEGWSISEEPRLVIGQATGDERYLLDRVHGVRRFEDGRIAILDLGSSRVRVYDATGTHLFDAGGPGEGPAEFTWAQYLDLMGDTIVVFEGNPPTATWFDDAGEFVRTVSLGKAPDGRPLIGYAFGILENQAMAVAAVDPSRPSWGPGVARERMALWRLPLDGSRPDSLLELRTDEVIVHSTGGWNQLAFGKTTYYAASDRRIYVGPSDTYSIQVLDPEGRLEQIIRRRVESRPVSEGDVVRYVEQMIAAEQGDSERIQPLVQRIREMGTAERMPAYRMLAVDSRENLWVEDWVDVGVNQGTFSVFRPDGVWLGRLKLPPGLPWLRAVNMMTSVLEIGDDYLLGVWVGELGVEEVRMYGIEKGSGVEPPKP